MEFEFDRRKSASNKQKHGIDFTQAQVLWHDPNRVYIEAATSDEARYILIGRRKTKLWTAIYTMRDDRIRIISVRRSRKEEVMLYEG